MQLSVWSTAMAHGSLPPSARVLTFAEPPAMPSAIDRRTSSGCSARAATRLASAGRNHPIARSRSIGKRLWRCWTSLSGQRA